MYHKKTRLMCRVVLTIMFSLFLGYFGLAEAKDGAKLFEVNCARCHNERFATEKTDAQWKTVLLHMRIRGQIPEKDADAILNYLQQSN